MLTEQSNGAMNETRRRRRWLAVLRLGATLGVLASASPAFGDGDVVTLGGGSILSNPQFFGFADGNTLQNAQFHSPYGCAVDNLGHLFVADRDNGKIRRIDVNVAVDASQTITVLSNLPSPVALAFDTATNFYVVTAGDGLVRKYTSFGNFVTNWPALTNPTAIALDANTNIYVTELGGAVKRLNPTNAGPAGVLVIEPTGTFHQPQGITMLNSGLLAVSDTGSNAVYLVNPTTKAVKLLAGNNGPGFTNGPPPYAAFNQPYHLFQAPSGNLIVVDRGNDRVRVITVSGLVTTLYGIDTNLWEPPYFGWSDGPAGDGSVAIDAAGRDPVGVTVDKNGVVYTTEDFYHIVREVTGSGFTGASSGGTGGTGGTNGTVVLPPVISPNSGYYPMGITITVTNPNSSDFFTPSVYYTTDGTEPTTNSFQLLLTNNIGVILWRNTTNDLTALRVRAFLGATPSPTVSGQPAGTNSIGITRDLLAGVGSAVVLPVVVDLTSNQVLRSIQYRVDLTPDGSAGHFAPNIPLSQLRMLPISTNDFVPIIGPIAQGGVAQFGLDMQSSTNANGQVTDQIGVLSSPSVPFTIKNFAVVGLLAVPIPPTAKAGDQYRIEIKFAQGTSDAGQTGVPLPGQTNVIIVSTNVSYLVGDTAPSGWYNAEAGTGFGDGTLGNDDVNNVFFASLGLRVPFPFTDVFDAMDVFPEDTATAAGGDGQIRFLDWQITLLRALRFETNNWRRYWAPGGTRVPVTAALSGSDDVAAQSVSDPPPGTVWVRPGLLVGGVVPNAAPNAPVSVPVYLKVAPGASVSGMEFLAVITNTEPQAPQVQLPATFSRAPGFPVPTASGSLAPNQVGLTWGFGAFAAPLTGSNLLGYINFTLPNGAPTASTYAIQFQNGNGASDSNPPTPYEFESIPGTVLVLRTNLPPASITSFEWKTNFFGSADSPLADDNADPDGDGVPNWAEYLAGTNPTNALSKLQLLTPAVQSNGSLVLSWLSAPNKAYTLESAGDLRGTNWTGVAFNLMGNGNVLQTPYTNSARITRFYRVRVQP